MLDRNLNASDVAISRTLPRACWRNRHLLAAAVALSVAGIALGTPLVPSLVDVNFYDSSATTPATESGAAVVGGSSDQWNNIGVSGAGASVAGSGISLNTTTGASSGLTLSYSAYQAANSGTNPTNPIAPGLMTQYLDEKPNTGGTSVNIDISGLAAKTTYNLYVYAASYDASGTSRATVITANGVSADATGNGQGSAASSFIEGDNYVLLTPTSNASGVITITQTTQPGVGEGDLNGLQIQLLVNTFNNDSNDSKGTGTNFWSVGGNWNAGTPAGQVNVALIPVSGSGTDYNADLSGSSQTVAGLNLGAGSNIYNSGSSAETLTVSPGSGGYSYSSVIAGDIGSTTGTLPGSSGGSGGSGGAINLVLDGGTNTVSGQLFGNLNLTVNGGTTTLSNNNSYTGTTTITGGTLALSGGGSLANSSGVNLSTGGTFDISQASNGATIEGLSGTGGTVALGGKALTVDIASGQTDTFSGAIQDGGIGSGTGGSLALDGSGTLVLNGTESFTGGVNLNSGTLAINSASAMGTGTLSFNGGTLQAGGGLSISNTISVGAGGGTFDTGGFSNTIRFGSINSLTTSPTTLTIDGGGSLTNDASFINSDIQFNIADSSTLYIENPGQNNIIFTGNATQGQLLFGLNGHTDELGSVSIADSTATTAQLIDGGGATTAINGGISNSDPNAILVLQDGPYELGGNNSGFAAGTLEITNVSRASFYNSAGGLGSGATMKLNNATIQNAALTDMTFNNAFVLGSGGGTIDANGNDVTLANAISGSGALYLESSVGGGSVVLSGNNTYTGDTTVYPGTTLSISADDNLGAASGRLILLSGSTLATNGNFSMSRPIYVGAGSNSVQVAVSAGDTMTLNGTISTLLLAGPLQLSAGPEISAGPIVSSTLTASGAGTLVLNGDNTYTGGTMIDAGATVVAGGDSAFGSGAIINAGTLATSNYMFDGPTPVVINASSLTLDSTSNLDLAIFGSPASGNYDYVSLGSGPATLAGKLNIRFINDAPINGQAYTVVKTTGNVSGSFAIVTSNASHVSFAQNEVVGNGYQIVIQSSGLPQLFNTTGLSDNQIQVADYFTQLSNQGQIPSQVINSITELSFLSGTSLANYLQGLTPQDYAQLTQPAIDNMIFEGIAIDGQVYDAYHGGGFDASGLALLKTSQSDPFALNLASAMQEADHQALLGQSMQELDAAAMPPSRLGTRWSGFLTGQIALDSAPQGGYPTQHFTTGSVMAGLDYRLTKHLLVGGIFNYAYTGGTLDNLGSREAANSYAPGLFAGYKLGRLQIDGLTQYTFNTYKINRNIVVPGYTGTATGEPVSNQYDASLMADYYIHPISGLDIGPSGGIAYTHMNVGGFGETGSPYALSVSKQSIDSFRTLLGFQGHWHLNKKLLPLPLVVSFNAFWQHEYIGRRGSLVASFSQIGPGSFLYNAPSPSRNSALLGLGIGGYLAKNTSLFVNYQTQIGDHRQFAQTVMAGVAIGF